MLRDVVSVIIRRTADGADGRIEDDDGDDGTHRDGRTEDGRRKHILVKSHNSCFTHPPEAILSSA